MTSGANRTFGGDPFAAFVRQREVDAIFQQVSANTRLLAVLGPLGIGKSTVLRAIHHDCQTKAGFIPVFCELYAGESAACSLLRLESALDRHVFSRRGLAGDLGSVLLNRIRSLSTVSTATDRQHFLLPLMERTIEPVRDRGYAITRSELKASLTTTLSNAARTLNQDDKLVMIIDPNQGPPGDLLDLLVETVERASVQIVLVMAIETGLTAPVCMAHFEWSTMLHGLSVDEVKNLAVRYRSTAGPADVDQKIWDAFQGDPLATHAALLVYDRLGQFGQPACNYISYDQLIAEVYGSASSPLKIILEVLSITHDGADTIFLSEITGIPHSDVITICSDEPLLRSRQCFRTFQCLWVELYHCLMERAICRLVSEDRRKYLCEQVGQYYLNLMATSPENVSYGAILEVPRYLANTKPSVFVACVLRALSLLILVGDATRSRNDVRKALGMVGDSFEKAMLSCGLGLLLVQDGQLQEATEQCFAALSILRRKDESTMIQAVVLTTIASLLQLQHRWAEALKCEEQALALFRRYKTLFPGQVSIGSHLSNIGLLYEKLGKPQEALHWYEDALQEDRRTNNERGIASDLRRSGAIWQDLKEYDRARRAYHEALDIDVQLNDLYGVAADYGNLGASFSLEGNRKEALDALRKALELFISLGADHDKTQVEQLIDIISKEAT